MINDERAYVSIFDLENDDIEMFKDQFSPLDYFLLKSKTFYNGTLIRLPLRTTSNIQISTQIRTLEDIKEQIYKYFYLNNSLIELLLTQTKLNTIIFDYTKDFQILNRFLSIEKHKMTTIHDAQSTTQIIHMNLSKLIDEIDTRFVFFHQRNILNGL
jgi:NurA-like 5'-3' nuclease